MVEEAPLRMSRNGLVTDGPGWFPVSKVAARHGASVGRETTKSAEAYASLPRWTWAPYEEDWLPDL